MKRVLFYAKSEIQIYANAAVFNTNYEEFADINVDPDTTKESVELEVMTKVFSKKGWECFWTCLDWLKEEGGTLRFYDPIHRSERLVTISDMNENFEVIIFRIIGTVEKNRDWILRALDILEENFKGLIFNHPKAMKYGITKDYLLKLQDAGFPVIPTVRFDPTVSFVDLIQGAEVGKQYIIKPTTGELSNSLAELVSNDCVRFFDKGESAFKTVPGEGYLRFKEGKLGGWLLQPLLKNIKNGEYQLIFFGEKLSHGLKKTYLNITDENPLPSQKYREVALYEPAEHELEMALLVREYFQVELLMPIYSFRFDYIKTQNDEIKILEFEILNPGFFLGYIKDDNVKFCIAYQFEKAILRQLSR